ncbi:MAG: hypothetical protein KZY61_08640 [Clostridiaceae bacterium]|nr:hypothetical protein [Clostridiaceae bacterium]MBW4859216.1 hypothetical protein [Clostridiaceae bacterium]MBW4868712.1 hypothetical protein [Clostridiaceae bacterium]
MPNHEKVERATEIISNSTENRLSEYEKAKLQDLEFNDSQIEEIVKMKDKMLFDNNNENKNKDELKPGENMSRKNPPRDKIPKGNKNKDLLMILIISILVLVIGLIFVFKIK